MKIETKRDSRRGVTFNWKQFFTLETGNEIIEEYNEIINNLN